MKRPTFITWEQLKVGAVILVALLVLTVGMFRLGQAANLFSERYELVTFVPNAAGLREGGAVAIAGQLAGIINEIEFLPPDADTTRNLRVVMAVDTRHQSQIRENSTARVRTQGLLGDKLIDVSPGTPTAAVLEPGDTIPLAPSLDYESVLTQAAGAVDDLVLLTSDLRQITGSIVRGEGTIGQLVTDRTLYEELTSALARSNQVLTRLQNPNGTFGRLLNDPALYEQLTGTLVAADSLLIVLNSQDGTLNKFLTDTTLYTNLVQTTQAADSILSLMATGDGFASKLLRDQMLYDQLNKLVTDMSALLEDMRQNPRKYFKGAVEVF